jgi:hypothetical protein
MKIFVHDEGSNEYLSKMFWTPLVAYAGTAGLSISYTSDADSICDAMVVVHGDRLPPERIQRIKDNGNKLCVFDVNDSSYFSSAYIHSPEQHLIDLIFKISGVPKRNEVNEMNLDRNFQIQVSREKYLPDPQWEEFDKIRRSGRIKPLPYVLWNPLVPHGTPNRPATARSGKVLIRGGNHFWRVVLAFRLMQEGLLDERSAFATAPYFKPEMERRFQFCESCIREKQIHGKSRYHTELRPHECTNPKACWHLEGEFFGGPMFGRHEHGLWNNRCPHSFFHLAKEFERCRGPLDHPFIERLFNGDMKDVSEFVEDLSQASFAGDAKWLNTINLPPRFWEAASVGTVSLYTARTDDQDYWPHVTAGEHYMTYHEDMLDFGIRDISPERYEEVSIAIHGLYNDKMRPAEYAISNALLEYMVDSIKSIL